MATTTINTPRPTAQRITPFDHVAKKPRTGPSPKNSKNLPREWVPGEENIAINRLYLYAEWYGATTDYCWRCPEQACGAVWTLYPTSLSCRRATGIAETCHHLGGAVKLSIPHQCEKCWTEWKPCRALPGVDHPAFAKARGSHTSGG